MPVPTSLGAVSVQMACAEPAGQCCMHAHASVVAPCLWPSIVLSGVFSLPLSTCRPWSGVALVLEEPFLRESGYSPLRMGMCTS